MAVSIRPHRWLVLCMGILALAGPPAKGELTVADLTGNAVTSVGPYFKDVNDAIRAYGRGDVAAALKHLQAAKESTPVLAPAEVMLAQLHFGANQVAAGNGALEQAIKSTPPDPEPYVILLERALADGRLTEAEAIYPRAEQAVETFNQNPRRKQNLQQRAYSVGAAADEGRGNLKAAQAKLDKLIKLDPTGGINHQRLGRILFAAGDADSQKKAFDEFKRAAELDKKALPAGLMMAMLYKEPAKVEQWVQFALKNDPEDARTQLGAANFYFRTNQGPKAREHAEKAAKLDPSGFESNLMAGLAAQMEGDYPTAVEYLSRAHLQQPANPAVVNSLAQSLIELPDEASQSRAREFAELNARNQPSSADLLATLGWVNYRLKRMSEAERAFTAALRGGGASGGMRSVSPDTSYYLSHLAASQGRPAEAVQMLRQMVNTQQPFVYRKMAQKMLDQLGGAAAESATGTIGELSPLDPATPLTPAK